MILDLAGDGSPVGIELLNVGPNLEGVDFIRPAAKVKR